MKTEKDGAEVTVVSVNQSADTREAPPSGMSKNGYFFQEMEQREAEQEEGSEGREEGQDSPIACGDDIHLYDNQISPGPAPSSSQFNQFGRMLEWKRHEDRQPSLTLEAPWFRL